MKGFVLFAVSLCLALTLSITALSACDGDSTCNDGNGVTSGCRWDELVGACTAGGCNKVPAKCAGCTCQKQGSTDCICRA